MCREPTSFTPRVHTHNHRKLQGRSFRNSKQNSLAPPVFWYSDRKGHFQTVVSTPVLSWGFIPTTPRNTCLDSAGRPSQTTKMLPVSFVLCVLFQIWQPHCCRDPTLQWAAVTSDVGQEKGTEGRGHRPCRGKWCLWCLCADASICYFQVIRASSSCIYCVIFLPKNVIFKACRADDPTFMEASPKMRSLFISCQCAKKCVWCWKV